MAEEKKQSWMQAWGGMIFGILFVLALIFVYFKFIKGSANDIV